MCGIGRDGISLNKTSVGFGTRRSAILQAAMAEQAVSTSEQAAKMSKFFNMSFHPFLTAIKIGARLLLMILLCCCDVMTLMAQQAVMNGCTGDDE